MLLFEPVHIFAKSTGYTAGWFGFSARGNARLATRAAACAQLIGSCVRV